MSMTDAHAIAIVDMFEDRVSREIRKSSKMDSSAASVPSLLNRLNNYSIIEPYTEKYLVGGCFRHTRGNNSVQTGAPHFLCWHQQWRVGLIKLSARTCAVRGKGGRRPRGAPATPASR